MSNEWLFAASSNWVFHVNACVAANASVPQFLGCARASLINDSVRCCMCAEDALQATDSFGSIVVLDVSVLVGEFASVVVDVACAVCGTPFSDSFPELIKESFPSVLPLLASLVPVWVALDWGDVFATDSVATNGVPAPQEASVRVEINRVERWYLPNLAMHSLLVKFSTITNTCSWIWVCYRLALVWKKLQDGILLIWSLFLQAAFS